jgi:hypothetical protein
VAEAPRQQPRYSTLHLELSGTWAVWDHTVRCPIVGHFTEPEARRLADALEEAPDYDRAEIIRQHTSPRGGDAAA